MKIRLHIIAFLAGILPFVFLTKALLFTNPPVWPDEPVFTSIAKHVADTGKIGTVIYGINDFKTDQGSFPYPPVYFWVLGAWGKYFGFSIASVRALSIGIALLTLLILYGILIELFKKPYVATIGLILITTDIWFNRISRLGRMEILVSFFTAAAFYAFLIMRRQKRIRAGHILLTGVLAAAAFLTHPIGILATMTISALTVMSRIRKSDKIKIISCLVICLTALTGIWLVSLGTIFPYFLKELRYAALRKSTLPPYILHLVTTSDVWKYIWLGHLTLFAIALNQIYRRKKYSVLFFLVPVILAYGLVYFGTEMWYIGYLQPWMTFFSIATLLSINKRTLLYQFTVLLIIVITVINVIMFGTNAGVSDTIHAAGGNYAKFSQAVDKEVPQRARVLVSVIPDPTYLLWEKRSTTGVLEFFMPPLNTASNYKKILDTVDVVVANKFLEPMLPSYVRQNTAGTPRTIYSGGYSATVYILVPKNQRVYTAGK